MLMMSMLIIMIMMILLMMIMIITMISMFPGRTRAVPGPDPDRTQAGLVGAMVPSPGTNEHPIGRTELLVTPIESP